MDSNPLNQLPRGANMRVRKLLGRSYLREKRLEEACQVYLELLADYPGDADVLTILANLYRLSGCPATAEHLYSRALLSNPENRLLKRQIEEVHEEAGSAPAEALPFLPEAIERMVARLRAGGRVELASSAAEMIERLLADRKPPTAAGAEGPAGGPAAEPEGAGPAGAGKEGLHPLMPALIELNMRQARADGRADQVDALHSLHSHISRQGGGPAEPEDQGTA